MKNVKIFSLGIAMLFAFLSFKNVNHSFTSKNELKTITGIVSDDLGPVAGANVIVKETKTGTTTDFDGKYTIKAKVGDILEFSYVGSKETRKVGKSTVINVKLTAAHLDEVFVQSSSIKRKKENIKMESKMMVAPNSNAQYDAIQGYTTGIQITHEKYDDKNAISSNDNEDYGVLIENEFESPKQSPLSTFSIDVDNASYTNIRRFINNGQKVPKDAVRVEEMVNFFKYNYSQPKDNHPFAIHTEYSDCPWNENHKLLKIGLQGKDISTDNLPNSNFVFLIDVSGSMSSQNKLPLLKESMKVLVNQMRKEDKVAIVVYAGAAGLVLPPTTGDKKETIINA
ncbi:MAG: von Willebrand factor type A domain-containing protein, partial [Flavobacteriaceae bacterium]|nr:von Willebrand factor type A domain-containing protein [Flavobacteriaceae bacterium]